MIMQNIVRGFAVCGVVAFIIGSYFYVKKMDGYDKYVLSVEIAYGLKAMMPLGREAFDKHEIDLYSPVSPDQKYVTVRIKDRRLVPWYEYERAKTLQKVKNTAWITLFDCILVLIFLSIISSALGRLITKDKMTRGARMVTKRELIREVRAYNKEAAKEMGMKDYQPYHIEQVEYPLRSETQHTLLAGSTGSGKTQLLLRLMKQVHKRNDRAIIYDKMRSFVPMFYNPETDHIMNPFDLRCPAWDIFSDARDMVEWQMIAVAIVTCDSEDDYWSKGARSIFANTANRLQQQCREQGTRPTLTDLLYLLTQSSVVDLHAFLEGTEAARHINPAADKQSASMLSTLSQSLTCLGFLKDSTAENPGFSIRKYMADDTLKGKVFLTSRDDQHSTIQPLLTMWMSLFTTSLMSQERSNNRLCWFFIDELPSLNRLPALEDGLAQARQYGGAFVLGIQVESQLQATYGDKGAQTIMGLTLNKAIFNPGDPATAKVMADALGKTEIIRRNEGISLGANRIRDGVSMNSQITQEHIVLPEELMNLQNLNFFLKMRGALPCAPIKMEYIPIDERQEGFMKDMHFMTRFNHKMSSQGSADAAKAILRHIRKTKSPEPQLTNFAGNEAARDVGARAEPNAKEPRHPRGLERSFGSAQPRPTPAERSRIDILTGEVLEGDRPSHEPPNGNAGASLGYQPSLPSAHFLATLPAQLLPDDERSGRHIDTEQQVQEPDEGAESGDAIDPIASVVFSFEDDDDSGSSPADSDEHDLRQPGRQTQERLNTDQAGRTAEQKQRLEKEEEAGRAAIAHTQPSMRVAKAGAKGAAAKTDTGRPAGMFGKHMDDRGGR